MSMQVFTASMILSGTPRRSSTSLTRLIFFSSDTELMVLPPRCCAPFGADLNDPLAGLDVEHADMAVLFLNTQLGSQVFVGDVAHVAALVPPEGVEHGVRIAAPHAQLVIGQGAQRPATLAGLVTADIGVARRALPEFQVCQVRPVAVDGVAGDEQRRLAAVRADRCGHAFILRTSCV